MGLLSLTLVPFTTKTAATPLDIFIAGLTSQRNIAPGMIAGVGMPTKTNPILKVVKKAKFVQDLSQKTGICPEHILVFGIATMVDQESEQSAAKNISERWHPNISENTTENFLYRLGRLIGTGAITAATHATLMFLCEGLAKTCAK